MISDRGIHTGCVRVVLPQSACENIICSFGKILPGLVGQVEIYDSSNSSGYHPNHNGFENTTP